MASGHVYHWKHGWIPLDHEAAMKKAGGNRALAARYLADAHGPEAGIRSRTDAAKATLATKELNRTDARSALAQVKASGHGDLLPGAAKPERMPYRLKPRSGGFNQEKIDHAIASQRAEIEKQAPELRATVTGPDRHVWTAIPGDRIEAIINDGRLKSAHEAASTAGGKRGDAYTNRRRAYENNVVGVPADVAPSQRPIYGYVADGPSRSIGGLYGMFHAQLSSTVHSRTTVTFGDSLSHDLRPLEHGQVATADLRTLLEARQTVYNDLQPGALSAQIDYVEAQIHGGVKVENIQKVVVQRSLLASYPKSAGQLRKMDAAIAALRAAGITVELA